MSGWLGGHCSTISSVLVGELLRVKERKKERERERERERWRERKKQLVLDGCVPALCSITALTDTGKGRKQQGVKRRETGANEVI